MFDRTLKQKVQNRINADDNSSFAMTGHSLEDSHIVPDLDHTLPAEEKAEIILQQMTLGEKIEMLGGVDNLAIKGNKRLKLPKVWCSDASAGVRCFKRATAFPVPVATTASWNRKLVYQVGETIGKECRAKGVSILLGPGVNIYRVPTCGRNFEYMGEDPHLASELVVPYIRGVQSLGVITTVKHFACNNSDYDRHRMNSVVDERTMREIYLPAFKAAVQKGDTKSVMSAYNPVNGTYASENHELLTKILREDWGFNGFVISDWISVYSTEGPLKAGLDLEMPTGNYLNLKNIKKLIGEGKLKKSDIDRPVRNLLTTLFEMGIYNRPLKDNRYPEFCEKHSLLALEAARESIVLLKNENGLLPLDQKTIKKIAVVGTMAKNTTTCGGGSCCVQCCDKISILEGIEEHVTNDVEVEYIEAPENKLTDKDKAILQTADVVIVAVGFTALDESECYDKSWELPDHQDRLIKDVADINANTIVTLTTGTGVETNSWLSSVPAMLHCFFLGDKGGSAIADVLFGKVNPSGKLPFTMAKKWEDFEAVKYYVKKPDKISALRILGPQGKPGFRKIRDMKYGEKLMVGYRHFDTNHVIPQFPFGFGLSYTTFSISELTLSSKCLSRSFLVEGGTLSVKFKVSNTGNVSGSEVVQLYINDTESSLKRPIKELKGFEKVKLDPGQTKKVEIKLGIDAFSFYNDRKQGWVAEPGLFILLVGNSSRNIVQDAEFELE
ncbi:glycoside hydrolase family 3 C-terminal domain-containing protein [bacterium]|nr:glycoside hydrolase family 3 C-terminal domain-containing protein [bacterium]